jgi:hypothetical protein
MVGTVQRKKINDVFHFHIPPPPTFRHGKRLPSTEAVTLFRFDSHFAAFRCTDLVIRAVDVLVTQPSELAFFPAARNKI